MKKTAGALKKISGKGLRFAIVAGRFNSEITNRLLQGAQKAFRDNDVSAQNVEVRWVPGSFEIPVLLQKLARTRRYHALVALGVVIRGGTPHFDYVAGQAAAGVMKVSLDEGIPIAFGVLTTDNVKQAMDRAGGRHGNKGAEAALVAIEMARLLHGK